LQQKFELGIWERGHIFHAQLLHAGLTAVHGMACGVGPTLVMRVDVYQKLAAVLHK